MTAYGGIDTAAGNAATAAGGGRRRGHRRGWRALAPLLALSAASLILAAPAQAAVSRPAVSTGGARNVTFDSALLDGAVNPNGSNTSYYFQYGLSRLYGGQTAIADAGAGTRQVKVALGISGLQPLTVYHYRLVAVNGAGAQMGADRTLLTTKVPLSLAILSSPNPVLYGGAVTIQGTLSGTGNGNREVVLQANPFPFGGFLNTGNPQLTSATGSFLFPILSLAQVTQFRVVTTTKTPVVSPVAVENVAVQVTSHVARTRRRGYARIYGTVTPAEDGMQVGVLRITHGHGVLAGGTTLHHHTIISSSFSRVVRVQRGVYRVLVRVTNGAQVSNYGQPLTIR
jgi:hypothetical protein